MKSKEKKQLPEGRKTPWYFYLILIILPIAFFVLLEIGLRIFNYGREIPEWVDAKRGKYIINPDIAYRYFDNVSTIPTSIEDVFDQKKKNNAFRVFVLGESTTAGYPYMPLGSFSRYVRKRLELVYPKTTVEVVNLSLTAVNSYTVLDLLPGVLEQKPDLILIYLGHNEYYGALGVGSIESLGSSRSLVNLILYLNKYKTIQLLKSTIRWVVSLFSSGNKNIPAGTLMSRMAKDQYISFGSSKYNAGLEQFEGNLRDIIKLIKSRDVPLIIGKVASNLKDQKPFISVPSTSSKTASQVYNDAENELINNNLHKADSLFRAAKDLDALRFRAPEMVNKIIDRLSKEYGVITVSLDSLLNSVSKDGIVGDNIMTDHVHPNLAGYQLIGKAYYETMERAGYLPKFQKELIPFTVQDSITKANFSFTDLDSTIGNYKIKLLKNDWPFIDRSQKKSTYELLNPQNLNDSLAIDFIFNKINWMQCQVTAASAYLKKNDVKGYMRHMDVLIYQYPAQYEYYDQAALTLLQIKDYDNALIYLMKRYNNEPNDFSAKWIGTIALYKNNINEAISYLNKSYQLNSADTQVLYNLAGAYLLKKDYQIALSTINECLAIDPRYPGAENLKQQLTQAVYSQSRK